MSLARLEKSKAFHLYFVSICLPKRTGSGKKGNQRIRYGRYDHRLLHVRVV